MSVDVASSVWQAIVAGLEWTAAHVAATRAAVAPYGGSWPSVVTLALGVKAGEWSRALERAAAALVADHGRAGHTLLRLNCPSSRCNASFLELNATL